MAEGKKTEYDALLGTEVFRFFGLFQTHQKIIADGQNRIRDRGKKS